MGDGCESGGGGALQVVEGGRNIYSFVGVGGILGANGRRLLICFNYKNVEG